MSTDSGGSSSWRWLPFGISMPSFALPTISLPTSIQRRLISFVLKRSLGHLLKPGQLDMHQIDSQISNGYVEVKDLELDSNAINAHLAPFPIRLQTGSLGKITARIPWPNPFTSSLGFSLSGLHLTLILPGITTSQPPSPSTVHLADSVASVAESFMHNELSTQEEAMVRESLHPDLSVPPLKGGIHVPPGSMDPFIVGHEEQEHIGDADGEFDPAGISMFATLIERLLARFEFDAADTQITITLPDHASFTLKVADIHYGTETENVSPNTFSPQASVEISRGEARAVRISGLTLSLHDLTPSHPPPFVRTSPPGTLYPTQEEGSDSDLDEATQLMMSQSLVCLPRRQTPPSPTFSASSAASGVYHSAISALPISETLSDQNTSPLPPHDDTKHHVERHEELFLSFTSEPIIIRLTTPPPYTAIPSGNPTSNKGKGPSAEERLKLDISIGLIACALRAIHVRQIISLESLLSTSSGQPRPLTQNPRPEDRIVDRIDCNLRVRGVMMLFLPNAVIPTSPYHSPTAEDHLLGQFFTRPLTPPRLSYSFVRIHFDSLYASVSPSTSTSAVPVTSISRTSQHRSIVKLSISDISVLSFVHSATEASRFSSSPILITDRHLPSSYNTSLAHVHPSTEKEKGIPLPSFDVVDWTNDGGHGASVKQWRTKPPQHKRYPSGFVSSFDNDASPSTSPTQGNPASPPKSSMAPSQKLRPSTPSSPAIFISFSHDDSDSSNMSVQTISFHAFIDLPSISTVLNFIDDFSLSPQILSPRSSLLHYETDNAEGTDTPPLMPRVASIEYEGEKERRRLEQLVIDDLDLEFDYGQTRKQVHKPSINAKGRKPRQETGTQVIVRVPLFRIHIRAPPPSGHLPRSGSLVLDLHALCCSFDSNLSAGRPQHSTKFNNDTSRPSGRSASLIGGTGRTLASIEFDRMIMAYSLLNTAKAVTLLSIGSLPSNNPDKWEEKIHSFSTTSAESVVLPSILLRSNASSSSSMPKSALQAATIAVLISVPSVYINLSKPHLDGIQFMADDVAQWAEHAFTAGSRVDRAECSRNPSLIGSRYFARRAGSGSTESGLDMGTMSLDKIKSELVIKSTLSKVIVRLNVPTVKQGDSGAATRVVDVTASDIDALVEFRPEGKDETVVSLNIVDVTVMQGFTGALQPILFPTKSLNLISASKPLFQLRFHSRLVPETTAKESRINVTLWRSTYNIIPDFVWILDLGRFTKAPPGAFESVIPSERTQIQFKVLEAAVRITPPSQPSALIISMEDVGFSTDLVGDCPETLLKLSVSALSVFLTDNVNSLSEDDKSNTSTMGAEMWKKAGYALLAEVNDLEMQVKHEITKNLSDTRVTVDRLALRIHLCADSISGITDFVMDLHSIFQESGVVQSVHERPKRGPTAISQSQLSNSFLRALDENAFKRAPDIGHAPDMINDDLPTNLDYLDASFGAAAGLRELRDDDLDDFPLEQEVVDGSMFPQSRERTGIVSNVGGETIKMLCPSLNTIEHFYDTLPPDSSDDTSDEIVFRLRIQSCDFRVFLYEGYDWSMTRKTIEEEAKEVRKRLAKIRQLLASGQTHDQVAEETSTLLFNSVYIGLNQDADELDPDALMAAIDEELNEDVEITSQSSWQSLKPQSISRPPARSTRVRGRTLNRSRGPSIEFSLFGLIAETDQYRPGQPLISRVLISVRDLEILDHMKTSTWSKFLTEMRQDSRGNTRETDSNMVRVEFRSLLPVRDHLDQEARLKVKILPLRLYVDQDALDFLKKFFSFKLSQPVSSASPETEIFFQHVEVFPVDIKLDYKPRRVDYRALREGRTIELMNFFHFDGAEMTLRHITLKGISGWPRLFDTLNDLWTPDVKANQLMDVVSGVSPIRSAVNVGSGVADLILLPIAQYKKDGRIIMGMQKGTKAFVKSTAMEAIKLGAQLATGTQVILEGAENILGGQFKNSVTAEALQVDSTTAGSDDGGGGGDQDSDMISKYADQPMNIKEGVQSAYRTLSKNIKSAGQTILAVPMEVYESSGNEGPARAVVRAVPIAVLKPMIGASEAVSKTLLGLRNTLDPDVRHENEAKYKHR